MVPGEGLEPSRPLRHRIHNPLQCRNNYLLIMLLLLLCLAVQAGCKRKQEKSPFLASE